MGLLLVAVCILMVFMCGWLLREVGGYRKELHMLTDNMADMDHELSVIEAKLRACGMADATNEIASGADVTPEDVAEAAGLTAEDMAAGMELLQRLMGGKDA